ncbi:hypothetical protein [Spirochaeta africana]|uniref:Uncharacterized protein n=1 Tax=Spirochaeta africana (strain ATCC 700263 / DSM 8902 / Z-7692) TaxID=889378 RepID=H9ULF0_SPIAZ|nr:hypothetical protein [Spirochaeta africana]AFG38343.1 hypothetical protein Spiaf_2311 [Spirochaeta africana DSM 8902]
MNRTGLLWVLVAGLCVASMPLAFGQSPRGSSSEFEELRQEIEVINELGRLFGFIVRMHEEESELKLTTQQAGLLELIVEEIYAVERLVPARAQQVLQEIEAEILTPEQLRYTDRLFLSRQQTQRTATTGSRQQNDQRSAGRSSTAGDGTGTEEQAGSPPDSLAAFVAGGAFNPLRDSDRQAGQDILRLRALLQDLAQAP